MQHVNDLYIAPNFQGVTFPGTLANGLFTPEEVYPTTAVRVLPGDTSVAQGLQILDNAIHGNLADGNVTTVFGYSQSAVIASEEMTQLQTEGVPSSDVNFVLVGDLAAPNGGLETRFEGLSLPSLGLTLNAETPPDTIYPTDIYSFEYDGYADFPRYPINFLSDLNAVLGVVLLHGNYPNPPADGGSPFLLPGSMTAGPDNPDPCTDCVTNYFMIPETPPLVSLLGDVPVIGGPLQDLLGPDLTYLINLGYGDGSIGYSTPADVPTMFGLFPNVDPGTVFSTLFSDTQQGITNFIADLTGSGPHPLEALALADPLAGLAAGGDPASFTDIINWISSALTSAYSTLLPTADIINALLTSVPAYDFELFVDNLQAGNLLDAIGLPIAADIGIITTFIGIEAEVLIDAIDPSFGLITP